MRALALLLVVSLAACTTVEPAARSCLSGKPAIETQLYFGLSKAKGIVTAREWQRFVEREIAPRFPQGFSVVDARGAWLSDESKRTIFEDSKLLVRVHDGAPRDNADIDAIVTSYKREFAQEAVMRVDKDICVAF